MSNFFAAGDSIVNSTGVDFSAALGKLVKAAAGVPAVNDSASAPALALVLEGNVAAKNSSLGILGGLEKPVLVRISDASGALKQFDLLQQAADGTFTKDTGAGTRCICGIVADPDGMAAAAGGLLAAVVFKPIAIVTTAAAAPAAAAPANGVFAALNSTAVNPTKADFDALLAQCEILRDSHAALVATVGDIRTAAANAGVAS